MNGERLFIGLLLVLSMGCHGPTAQGSDDRRFLRVASREDVPSLDPARGYDTVSWQFEDMLFSTLVDYDYDSKLVRELALSWTASPDGLTYTFQLRPDVHFSNGRLMTAADVRYAIERVLTPASKSPGAEFYRGIEGAESCATGPCRVDGIEVVADDQVRFHLRDSDPLFLHKLAMPFAAPVPREVVEQWGEDFGRHPVGTGPFQLQDWRAGQRLVVVRNPLFYDKTRPHIAGVVQSVGVNRDLEWMRYDIGELDLSAIPPPEYPLVVRQPRYQPLLRQVTTMRTQYLGLNCNRPPFDDVRIRRALNLAIDKDKLLRLVNRRGVAARGILPPTMPGYNANLPGYEYSPTKAREMLRETGWHQTEAIELWLRNDETTVRLAQALQQDLAAIGFVVQLKPVAWGPFLDAVKSNDLVPMFLLGWEADFPDPSNFLDVLFHSRFIGTNNNTNYRSAEVDEWLDRAARMTDANERLELLGRVEERIIADAPWVPLYHPVDVEIISTRVHDFRLHPLRPARFDELSLSDTGS